MKFVQLPQGSKWLEWQNRTGKSSKHGREGEQQQLSQAQTIGDVVIPAAMRVHCSLTGTLAPASFLYHLQRVYLPPQVCLEAWRFAES